MSHTLFAVQEALQDEANKVIRKLGIMELLQKFGEPKIVGSLALGLMVWRDVDIEVPDQTGIEPVIEIAKYLLNRRGIKRVTLENHYDVHKNGKPAGYYVGALYSEHASKQWKIDIWLVRPGVKGAASLINAVRSKLTPAKRDSILAIKHAVVHNPEYRKSILSVDVYDAVFHHNAKTVQDFQKYLEKTGRHMNLMQHACNRP